MLHTMTDDNYDLMLKVHNVAPFKIVRVRLPTPFPDRGIRLLIKQSSILPSTGSRPVPALQGPEARLAQPLDRQRLVRRRPAW